MHSPRDHGNRNDVPSLSQPLPTNLEHYLPPYLWRTLTEEGPRRGILLNTLERLRSLRYLLSTYLPHHLVQEKIRRPQVGLVQGQLLWGSLLFADISGFTALSERLAHRGQAGAEELTELMNVYFDRMLDVLSRSGGILLKFAGDALLAYFPQQEKDEQARWAVRAGQRMMRAMVDFATMETSFGAVALQIKIGASSGSFLAASIGSKQRMEYVLLGRPVTRTMAAEGIAEAGQLIVDAHTRAALAPLRCPEKEPGFFLVPPPSEEELGEFEIKVETRRPRESSSWLAGHDEIIADIEDTLEQIEALSPFLPSELVEHITARAELRRIESEFRRTAVLFANFTGLESLLPADGDPPPAPDEIDWIARILSDYFQVMHQAIARHGGVISRIDPYKEGSKMLVLFGAPVAHEDDPQRAVRAALEMNARLSSLNQRWCRRLASKLPTERTKALLQQRVGITQGLTYAGQAGTFTRREYTVMGDDVNLAARLMGAAQAGQILLSQHVYEAVEDHFHLTSLPPIQVKGKRAPVPIYQADGLRDDRLARRLRGQGPLIGRAMEFARARQVLQQTLAGRGTRLTLRGPAGIGKSRLADALAAAAMEQGAQVFLSEGESYASAAPYAPWITLLQAMSGIGPADSIECCSRKFMNLSGRLGLAQDGHAGPLLHLMGLPDVASTATLQQPAEHHVAPPQTQAPKKHGLTLFDLSEQRTGEQKGRTGPGSAGLNLWDLTRARDARPEGQMWQRLEEHVATREQARLADAICALLERLSAETPLLLLFENTQWMDTASRELLHQLDGRLHAWPVLVLLVQRDEETDVDPSQVDDGQTIILGPLGLEETDALVIHLLGEKQPLTDQTTLIEAIHKQSEGNPLFIEEIVRALQRSGSDAASDLMAAIRASSTLHDLVISHLDSLPYSQRTAAKAASVVGSTFCASDLDALLAEEFDQVELAGSLAGLEEARLMLLLEAGPDTRHAFRQTLIRELIYESQAFSRRRELHGRLANHLENIRVDALDLYTELLAHHYEMANQWLPATAYLLLSGQKARLRYAYPQAVNYYNQALAVLERSPATTNLDRVALRTQAHEGLGDVALLRGEFALATAAYRAAYASWQNLQPPIALPEEQPANETECRILVKLGLVLPTQGRSTEAEDYLRRAWMARPVGGDMFSSTWQGLATAATMAWLLWRAGSVETEEWLALATALAAAGTDRWAAGVAAMLADLAGEWEMAQEVYQSLDMSTGAALTACRRGDRHLAQGDHHTALALYEQAAAIWDRDHDIDGLALARYRQAEAYWQQADAAVVCDLLRNALALLDTAPEATAANRQVLKRTIDIVEAGGSSAWPAWFRQDYEDAFYISVLFRP